MLEAGRVPNLASRALGLSLRRLSRDIRAAHGYPVLLAETFVDPSRFAGSRETAYGLTSLGAGQAGPEELAALVRCHWHIENRLHYVRDFTYDEDRCRAHVGNLPRNLACLTNAAISIVRHEGRFEYLPPARRRPSTPS